MEERLAGQWCWGRRRGRGERNTTINEGGVEGCQSHIGVQQHTSTAGCKTKGTKTQRKPPQLKPALIDFPNEIGSRGRGLIRLGASGTKTTFLKICPR